MLEKKLKGRTSHHLQQEFPMLGKRYWGRHFQVVGYVVWSTDNITDQMVQEYLEHHNEKPNAPTQTWILE
jgi:putative transposase